MFSQQGSSLLGWNLREKCFLPTDKIARSALEQQRWNVICILYLMVFVKTCIIVLRQSTFLKEKQIYHVIEFSFLFEPTDSLFHLDNDSTKIKIESD